MSEPEFDDGAMFRAATGDAERDLMANIVALITASLAPWYEEDIEHIHQKQGFAVAAAAMFAGRTAGHLQGMGVIDRRSAKRMEKMLLLNFAAGKKIGLTEVGRAMEGQRQ